MAKRFIQRLEKFYGLKYSSNGAASLSDGESSEMVNFKITPGYKLKKRDGYTALYEAESTIRGIYIKNVGGIKKYYALDGDTLYVSSSAFTDMVPLTGTVLGNGKVSFILLAQKLYILTGVKIYEVNDNSVSEISGYVPTLSIETQYTGEGTLYEDVNLISDTVKQEFIFDSLHGDYKLLYDEIGDILSVTINGETLESDSYYYNTVLKCLIILSAPAEYEKEKMVITYTIPEPSEKDKILSCKYGMTYGGANDTRAFLYGSDDAASVRFNTGMADGNPRFDYFPASGYTVIGTGNTITSILRQYDRQIIFTENEAYYSYIEYETDSIGRRKAIFPVFPLSSEIGNVPKNQATLVDNAPITLNAGGLFKWVATNIRDERNAVCVSDSIAQFLSGESAENAVIFNRKGESELYIVFDNRIYIYNYLMNVFYYYEAFQIKGMLEDRNDFYIYSDSFIAKVGGNTDNGSKIDAVWKSKKLDLGDISKYKNLFFVGVSGNKLPGDAVKVKISKDDSTSEEVSFDLSGTNADILGIITKKHRIKKKRATLFLVELNISGKNGGMLNEIILEGSITDKYV